MQHKKVVHEELLSCQLNRDKRVGRVLGAQRCRDNAELTHWFRMEAKLPACQGTLSRGFFFLQRFSIESLQLA